MKLKILRGRESLKRVLEGEGRVRDLTYLFNVRKLSVDYLLLHVNDEKGEWVAILDYHNEGKVPTKIDSIIRGSGDFESVLRKIDRTGDFVCVDPTETRLEGLLNPDADIAVMVERLATGGVQVGTININLGGEHLSVEELKELLMKGEVEELNNLLMGESAPLDVHTVEEVLSDCTEYDIDSLDMFLGHVLFRLTDEENTEELYQLLLKKLYETEEKGLRALFMEKSLYACARLVEGDTDETTYKTLKDMLEEYVKGDISDEKRAFTIYEVITSLATDNTEVLKDILYSFDRYIPYTEEFSPLIFGDLGMSFHERWEETENQEYRELSLVLLQKAMFSVNELLKLGRTEDFPMNLGNLFAYLSVLIPMLAEEMENSPSQEVREAKETEIKESLCLGIQLFLEFSEEVSVESFADIYPTEEDARVIVESTFENFLTMVLAYFEAGVEMESEEVWEETVSDNPTHDELIKGALKVREILCPRR
ncbi:hypothetical protein [Hydrogenivirga sp. 128-5-R1-1]|uniref:hypothetical protein n=1 Tax=Hydrogenivirga sp. 128-5-R1-1 TaxID=392423 RepID=UPI00015F16B7|nr:hypothetical protein [Hydrogenivirga sp. 128-5-R1-1]EDP76180.1 hypothetical protein HG1285_18459 [Hydrogenivirga sp. 128-5-R1-1]